MPTLSELFQVHYRTMVRLAALLGADDPEDIAQEAFARLHGGLGGLRDPGAAVSYVRKTVVTLTNSRHRHLKVVRRHLAAAGPLIDEAAPAPEIHDDLLAAIAQLPRRQRQVIVLRYWLDLSEAQIAEDLGIANGTVKATASKALKSLEKRLNQENS